MDLRARLLYLDVCHPSLAGTGAICLAAASRIEGTLANRALGQAGAASASVRIGHPRGVIDVRVSLEEQCDPKAPRFAALGFARTARRLMAGNVYVPDSELA
jgi:2-methylaconitate cis-trans-isomerase PrpF